MKSRVVSCAYPIPPSPTRATRRPGVWHSVLTHAMTSDRSTKSGSGAEGMMAKGLRDGIDFFRGLGFVIVVQGQGDTDALG